MGLTKFTISTTDEIVKYLDSLHKKYYHERKDYNFSHKNIYLAGPWFDNSAKILCEFVEDVIREESLLAYKRIRQIELATPLVRYQTFFPRQGGMSGEDSPKNIFDRNVQEVANCDVLIAMISRKDTGTAWEIGMAHALGKEIILLGYDETDFTESKTNLMLAFCGKAITLDKLVKYLRGNMTDEDYFTFDKDDWKVIE